MDSSSVVGSGVAVDAGRAHRNRAVFIAVVVAIAFAAAIVLLVRQAEPASAQISIGSIVCPILRSIQAAFGGFLGGIINALLAAFGC